MVTPGVTAERGKQAVTALLATCLLCLSGVTGQIPDDRMKLDCNEPPPGTSVYNFNIRINNNGTVSDLADWSKYRGNVVLVLNVASF